MQNHACGIICILNIHHLQPQSEPQDIHPRFLQFPKQRPTQKITKHKNKMNYIKITRHGNKSSNKTNRKIGNLNVSVTIDHIYELFGLRITEYLP